MILKRSAGEKVGITIIYIILIVFGLITLLPMLNVLAKSLSGEIPVISGHVMFWPVDFQIGTYKYIFTQGPFTRSFIVSVFRTVIGTVAALVISTMTAYPLSKPNMRGRKLFLYLWVAVMLFRGGIIPNYMLYKGLGLTNTFMALIMPSLVTVFNLLIIKNYMEGIPESLSEAARIDGASNSRTLFQIIVPVCVPVLATMALFYAVAYWNDYFFAMLYVTKPSLMPLQQYLFNLITQSMMELNIGTEAQSISVDTAMNLTSDSVRAAAIIAATVPILAVYPFMQNYFIKGIVIGSVKG
jgi:putative aldouronate transport system permease protein